jgi:peptidyl-dipeptidase Dcp
MKEPVKPADINIRTELRSGDIGFITWLHGTVYKKEYDYGISFESYVAGGLYEFYSQFNARKDRVWIAEHDNKIIGFLLLMHRDNNTAQLRYFLITEPYRGIGLGNQLMTLYIEFAKTCGYHSSYLWTTSELVSAATLYKRYGFKLVQEKESDAFGLRVTEQRYEVLHE